jgi:hypothetical protein
VSCSSSLERPIVCEESERPVVCDEFDCGDPIVRDDPSESVRDDIGLAERPIVCDDVGLAERPIVCDDAFEC